MIQILRRKFVITAMAAISALLIVLLGVINTGNLIINSRRIDQVLDNLVESDGLYLPPGEPGRPPGKGPARPPSPPGPTADEMLGARYFLARFDADGEIVGLDMDHIYAVDKAEAQEMAQTVYTGSRDSGRLEQFQFRIVPALDERGSLVIFLDVSTQIRPITTIFMISLAVGALCWIIMLLLVIFLSQRAIMPVAENIEKQKQFVTNAGHEIKTPLSIILINTDALELHLGTSKWSRNIRAQTVRLNGLMQNLLTLAKMDESGSKLPLSPFSASLLLLDEVLYPYQEVAVGREISLQADIQPDVTLVANRESIMQLFSILLDNAAKYTPSSGEIEVTLTAKGKHTIFQVKNTCDSISEMDFTKLFDRFYRCDTARTQKDGGYGIGLSAAQAIVQAHGGTITASSADGGKAILFSVTL